MEKKYQIIYIWSFIVISGLVLLLLYTPLGGDLHYAAYNEQNRYAVAPGVNYNSQIGSIGGSNNSNNSTYSYYSAPSPYNSQSFKNISSASPSSSFNNSESSGSGFQSSGVNSRTKKSGSEGGSGGSDLGLMGVSKRSNTEVNNSFSDGGALGGTLINSTNSGNSTVIQRGTTADEDPLDPGGDPLGGPLPLGDEMGTLILLALIFTFYKWKSLK